MRDMCPVNVDKDDLTAFDLILRKSFSVPFSDFDDGADERGPVYSDFYHHAVRQAAQELGLRLLDENAIEIERVESKQHKRYVARLPLLKDPREMQRNLLNARNKISQLESEVSALRSKLQRLKDAVNDL